MIVSLKGQCHEIFCFWFFQESVSPPAQSISLGPFQFFCENFRRYSQVKVHHWYQQHRRQICHWYQRHQRQSLPQVSLVLFTGGKFAASVNDTGGKQWEQYQAADILKWTWRQKFMYNSTIQRCPKKLLQFFWLKIFLIATGDVDTGINLELRISSRIFEKIQNGVLRGLEKTELWKKNQKSKISWHCPFKLV